MLSFSKILLHGSAAAGSSRTITALGIIQLNADPSPLAFSLLFLFSVLPAVCGGGGRVGGSESSLGSVLHDPVIWLDMQPLGWEQGRL